MPDLLDLRFKGLTIPLTKKSGGVFTVEHTREIIRSSVRMILGTRIGERVMTPSFGSNLDRLVFEPNDVVLHALVRTNVRTAIETWEPRVEFDRVEIETVEHELRVVAHYRILAVGLEDSVVLVYRRE